MRKIRDVLRLTAGGMSKRKIAASLSIGATAAGDCMRRARRAGVSWPLPEDLTDAALERLFVSAAAGHGEGSATTARLAGDPSRAAPAGRDAAAVVGGASRRPPRGLRLQPVLRTVSRLGGAPVADHAAERMSPASRCSSTMPARRWR